MPGMLTLADVNGTWPTLNCAFCGNEKLHPTFFCYSFNICPAGGEKMGSKVSCQRNQHNMDAETPSDQKSDVLHQCVSMMSQSSHFDF